MLFSPVKMPQARHCWPFAAYGLTELELTVSNPKVSVQPYKVFWACFVDCSSESLRDGSGLCVFCLRANDHLSLWLSIQAGVALSPPLPLPSLEAEVTRQAGTPGAWHQGAPCTDSARSSSKWSSRAEGKTAGRVRDTPSALFSTTIFHQPSTPLHLPWSELLGAREIRGRCACGLSGEQDLTWSCKTSTWNFNQG